MKLAVVVREGEANPAARVRALQHIHRWQTAGVEVRVLGWRARSRTEVASASTHLLSMARWADVVLLQRPSQPPSVLRTLARVNPALVVDFDDALWVDSASRPSGAYAERLTVAVAAARIVTPGSDHLAGWVAEVAPEARIEVVRPSVDLDRAVVHEPSGDDGAPVIGWLGSPGNLRDLDGPAAEALATLVAEGRARLRIVSSAPWANDAVPSEVVAWSADTEAASVASFDLGIMPLQHDARSLGRCGYKAIQYLAAGVPAVVSAWGAGTEVVVDGQTGAWATDAASWTGALQALLDAPAARARRGVAGRAWVAEHASAANTADRLLTLFHEVAR